MTESIWERQMKEEDVQAEDKLETCPKCRWPIQERDIEGCMVEGCPVKVTVSTAEPGDIYVDVAGKLWRVLSVCREPTVVMEEVEGRVPKPAQDYGIGVPGAVFMQQVQNSIFPDIIKDRKTGGVGGLMWAGFKRIWRKEKT